MKTALIILGAAVWPDGPSPTLARRTRHGAALFAAGKGDVIVACGGTGTHPPSEAKAMRNMLVEMDVPAEAIHCEDQSTTTYENLRFALSNLDQLGISSVTIVTDAYHGRRAVMVARALGLTATSDTIHDGQAPLSKRLRNRLREAVAISVYALCLPYWIKRDR